MELYKKEVREREMLLRENPHVLVPQHHHHDHHHHHHHRQGHAHAYGYDHARAHARDNLSKLIDHLQSVSITEEPNNPFLLERNLRGLSRRNPISPFNGENHNVDFSSSSISNLLYPKNFGFDPYWDSYNLNLSTHRRCQNDERFDYKLRNRRGFANRGLYGPVNENSPIYLLAKDQQGCKYLQEKIYKGKDQVDLIYDGVFGHMGELMMDPSGSSLMQKLFELCSEEQKTRIALALKENPAAFFEISVDEHGTMSVQKLIENLKTREQSTLFMTALKPWLLDLIKDINGNHVIKHCLKSLVPEDTKCIFDAAIKYCNEIATDRHGCCVMQGCIGRSSGDCRTNLVAKICSNGLMLAQDAFGNYVVQYVIGLKSLSTNTILASQFQGHYVQLSMQKFSSNVVEKCFKEFHEELKAAILFEILAAPELEELLQHPFANYVIQSALSNTTGAPYTALVDAIRSHAAVLRTSPYCKRILALLRGKSLAF